MELSGKQSKCWVCDQCARSFSCSSNLSRHYKTVHPERTFVGKNLYFTVEELFECPNCSKEFRRKDNLKRHIHFQHNFSENENLFECFHCTRKFKMKSELARHISCVHADGKGKANKVKCLKCESVFSLTCMAMKHYEETHHIKMEYEELKFESAEAFESWKTDVQRKTVTQFTSRDTWTTSEYAFRRFVCHRSGMYEGRIKKELRKRRLKMSGTKKLQGFCPAEISLKIRNGIYFVKFQSTHVGHCVSDKKELRYIHLDKHQKWNIAAMLQDGVSPVEILKRQNMSSRHDENMDRLSVLNYCDVKNIAMKMRINNSYPLTFKCDEVDVDSFVIPKEESVLYHKAQGQEDEKFGVFEKDDFVIVIMDRIQKENLLRYGHKVIAFDGTYRSHSYDFILHAIFVLDANCVGLPVAFLFSNRSDKTVIDAFLKCVRDHVGIIETKTFISDLQNSYYTSWVDVMKPPQFYLFCAWHVKLAWQNNLGKISDKKKRAQIRTKLHDIAQELDETLFTEKLSAFISIEDEDLRDFLDYFKEFFSENAKNWAYCYRKYAGANANTHIENFLRLLKRNIARGKKIKTLSEGLKYVFEYLTIMENETLVKCLRGSRLKKLDSLIENHRLAAQANEKNEILILHVDGCLWHIKKVDNVTDVWIVEKIDEECSSHLNLVCQLSCEHCKICFHQYKCSCADSAIHCNMCIHIHMLGIHLQNK